MLLLMLLLQQVVLSHLQHTAFVKVRWDARKPRFASSKPVQQTVEMNFDPIDMIAD